MKSDKELLRKAEIMEFLEDFIETYDENQEQQNHVEFRSPKHMLLIQEESGLDEEYEEFCEKHDLDNEISAHELLNTLLKPEVVMENEKKAIAKILQDAIDQIMIIASEPLDGDEAKKIADQFLSILNANQGNN